RDRLADRAAHAAADEREVDRRDDERVALDRRGPVERARLRLRALLRGGDPLGVGLGIREREHVLDLEVGAQLLEAALVQQLRKAVADLQAEVVVALRADAEVATQALVVDEAVAGRAAQPLRRDLAGG